MKTKRKKRCGLPTINNAKDRLLQDIENYCDDKKPSSHNRFPVSFSALIPAHQRRWQYNTISFFISSPFSRSFSHSCTCVPYTMNLYVCVCARVAWYFTTILHVFVRLLYFILIKMGLSVFWLKHLLSFGLCLSHKCIY